MAAETVLIIDDDPDVVEITAVALGHAGLQVLETTSAPEGLDLAVRRHPDLILLDYMMPAMDGFEVLETLKRRRVPTRVIFVTAGFQREEDKVRAMRAGACDYLLKPVDGAYLVERVQRALAVEPTLDVAVSDSLPLLEQMQARIDRLSYENKELQKRLDEEEQRARKLVAVLDEKDAALARRLSRHTVATRLISFVVISAIVVVLALLELINSQTALILLPVLVVLLLIPLERATEFIFHAGKVRGRVSTAAPDSTGESGTNRAELTSRDRRP